MKHWVLAIAAVFVSFSAIAGEAVEDRYNKACAVCHTAGAAGAPKTGNTADWQPRLAKGMDVLLGSVKNGFNAMPPMGMCYDCSDDDFKALITFMSTPQQ